MKRISKVLAVVLALTMLVATSVLPASATDLENATLKLSFKNAAGDTITSAAAGSVVDVFVSLKVDAFVTQIQYYLNYNSDYVMHNRHDRDTESAANKRYAAEWLGDFANDDEFEIDETSEYYEFDQANKQNEYYLNWGAETTEEITLYNPATMPTPALTSTELIKVVYATNPGDQVLLVNTKGEYYEMLRIRFYVKEDIAKIDSSIFFFDPVATTNIINIDTNNVPFANFTSAASTKSVNISYEYEGGSTPAPQMTIVNASTQVQWQDKATGKLRLGFRGNVQNLVPDFVEGSTKDITNIKCMGIVYSTTVKNPTVKNEVKSSTVNGETVYYCEASDNCTNVPTRTLYDFTSGGYFFRSVVGGVGKDDATVFYANAYMVLPDDTIVYATNGATETSGKAQYERAQANLEK